MAIVPLLSPPLSSWQLSPTGLASCLAHGFAQQLLSCRPPFPPSDSLGDTPSVDYNLTVAPSPSDIPGACPATTSTSTTTSSSYSASASSSRPVDGNVVLAANFPRGTVAGPGSVKLGVTGPQQGLQSIGGASTYLLPFDNNHTFPRAVLSYSVYFPTHFDFVRGGKLPGLYAHLGRSGDTKQCRGGVPGTSCWSVRVMWRAQGAMEIYAYVPDVGTACGTVGCATSTEGTYGISLGRGMATFRRGCWNKLDLVVQVNEPPGSPTGLAELYVNGFSVIRAYGLVFRASNISDGDLYVKDLFLSTFFGGDTLAYAAAKDEVIYFKDISVVGGFGFSASVPSVTTPSGAMPAPRLSLVLILLHFFILHLYL